MKCVIPVVTMVMLAVHGADGLRCYACTPNREIAGATLPKSITDRTRHLPRCSDMDAKDPGLQFEMTCPPGLDKSCVKIRDERGNELRSCFGTRKSECSKKTKKGQVLCLCRGDFCNSAPTTSPALLALFAPLVAALLRLQ